MNLSELDENLKTEHDKLVLIINNSKETHDKMLKEITEKLVVVEKAQDNIDIQMIKETIDSLEDKYSKAKVRKIHLNQGHFFSYNKSTIQLPQTEGWKICSPVLLFSLFSQNQENLFSCSQSLFDIKKICSPNQENLFSTL